MAKRKSYQDEVPPSRVNIRYDRQDGDSQEKVELPLKLLLLGDYTLKRDDTPLEERERVNVNSSNFDSVMGEQNLKLSMVVPNRLSGDKDDEVKVDLNIDSMRSFTPDEIAQNVPSLRKMIEVRNLLKDLRARVITSRKLRRALEGIVTDPAERESLMKELECLTPAEEAVSGTEE